MFTSPAAAVSFLLHLDKHLSAMIAAHGTTTYAILWAIVFLETGVVVTPFLPGDSLLFAAGAFAGMGQLHLGALWGVFMSAAVLGDAVNYAIGSKLGACATCGALGLGARHVQGSGHANACGCCMRCGCVRPRLPSYRMQWPFRRAHHAAPGRACTLGHCLPHAAASPLRCPCMQAAGRWTGSC